MLRKIERKKTQNSRKSSKLKQKTQGLGGTHLFPLPKWCYKKSLIYVVYKP